MTSQLERIRRRLTERGVELNPPVSLEAVLAFESRHAITLPEGYRRFITELGDGGPGPIDYGILPLEELPSDLRPDETVVWAELADVTKAFPFTKPLVWEDGDESDEGGEEQLSWGTIRLGTDGCGMYWHLIITGPDRGIPWMICGEGIQPVCPKRPFLDWYEDWLDGRGSFYGYR